MNNRRSFLKSLGLGAASLVPLRLLTNNTTVAKNIDTNDVFDISKWYEKNDVTWGYDEVKKIKNDPLEYNIDNPPYDINKNYWINSDYAWSEIMQAGLRRCFVVYDTDAMSGQFTTRLINLMSEVFKFNSYRVTYKKNPSRPIMLHKDIMTDLYVSPSVFKDIKTWFYDWVESNPVLDKQIPPIIISIFGIKIHSLPELEEDGCYMRYFLRIKGNSLPKNKTELVIGLNLQDELNSNTLHNNKVILGSI